MVWSLSLKRGFLTSKILWFWENYLWNTIHNHGMHSAPQFIPLENRGASRGDVVNSDTAAHWKSAQTETVSLQPPGRHFSVYAVAQDILHLLAKWSQKSYLQQVRLELYWYSNTPQNDSESHFLRGFLWLLKANSKLLGHKKPANFLNLLQMPIDILPQRMLPFKINFNAFKLYSNFCRRVLNSTNSFPVLGEYVQNLLLFTSGKPYKL